MAHTALVASNSRRRPGSLRRRAEAEQADDDAGQANSAAAAATTPARRTGGLNGDAGRSSRRKGAAVAAAKAGQAGEHGGKGAANGAAQLAPDASDEPAKAQTWRAWWIRWEIPRKVLHTSIGFFAINGWLQDPDVPQLVFYLAVALGIIITADVLRFRFRRFAWLYELLLGFLMRPSEKTGWNGVIFYLIGAIFSLSVLPRDLATFSILILSWCDTAASTIGQIYGRHTPKLPSPPFAARKSLAGFLGAFVVGCLAGWVFWTKVVPINATTSDLSWLGARAGLGRSWREHHHLTVGEVVARRLDLGSVPPVLPLPSPKSTMSPTALTLVCGIVGAVAESLDVLGLDDNATLPIVSGLAMYALMRLAG